MNRVYLNEEELPFCKGCGHSLISENIDKALQILNIPVLDVIIVTDIGCHGIIDKNFKTHTVHGLHGRSVALAGGISKSIDNPDKKIIVFIGDGGATIGMQHLIDAAHKNINLTVVIHNNMLYGMTGGQPSEFTPLGFKTPTLPDGSKSASLDICKLITVAGASYVSRIMGIGNISEQLAEAISRKGFSLVEVMEVCPSYALKSNPGMKLKNVVDEAGLEIKVFIDKITEGYKTYINTSVKSLIESSAVIKQTYTSSIKHPLKIMISGSAGEGIQAAAELFAKAAISSGLSVTKKGSYPVTVGVGFSSSDIIISPEKILYTGSPNPDYLIITSMDGLEFAHSTINNMKFGTIIIDSELPLPKTDLKILRHDFRKFAGIKNAAIYSLLYLVVQEKVFPIEAMKEILANSKFGAKLNTEELIKNC